MNIRHLLTLILGTWILLCACQKQQPGDPLKETNASTHYASLLQMQDVEDGVTICRIMNPWQRIAIQYLLTDKELADEDLQEIEEQFGPSQTLKVPLTRQTVTSSCHLWLLEQLRALNSVSVVCDAEFVILPAVQEALSQGKLSNGGNSMAPNTEIIKEANSSCIWISPYEDASLQVVSAQLPDVAIIYCADYMESSPLARAEWMRFYGRLVGKAYSADSLFSVVEKSYQASVFQSSDSGCSPKILTDLPYGATWYVPAGRSTLGQMYLDAGFCYPWANDPHGGSLSLSPEAVFAQDYDADLWIFKHHDPSVTHFSMDWLLAQHQLFAQFKAAQQGQVYGCNTAHSDYFDATPFRPDLLLQELVALRKGKTEDLHYFKKLQ